MLTYTFPPAILILKILLKLRQSLTTYSSSDILIQMGESVNKHAVRTHDGNSQEIVDQTRLAQSHSSVIVILSYTITQNPDLLVLPCGSYQVCTVMETVQ